ncbi:MAG: hypothetical protein ACE5HK_07460 [Candidatus Methylomirabilales bacterium]
MKRWVMLVVGAVLVLEVGGPALAQEQGEVNIRGELPTTGKIEAEFAGGAREVNFRDLTLTDDQLVNPTFWGDIGAAIPNRDDGVERQVKIRGVTADGRRVEMRVKREEGTLRARVEGVHFATPDAARAFAAGLQGFDRVRVEGFDANGNRVRIERRNGVVRRDEVRPDHRGRGKAEDRRHRGRDKASRDLNDDHAKDFGRDDHNRHRGRDHEVTRGRRGDDGDRVEKLERHHRSGRREHAERRRERHERRERHDRHDRVDRSGRH